MKYHNLLRHNYREISYVFLAFAVLVFAAYFSVGNILRNRLLNQASEMIAAAEANVSSNLLGAETILLNSSHNVQSMIEQDASIQEILDYLTDTTEWLRQRTENNNREMFDFYGIYGYINGEFIDGIGMNPGDDYIPQTRPWYQIAVRSGNRISYTPPYIDWHTGDNIISAAKNIFASNGSMVGILVLDINIQRLLDYVNSLAITQGGYGILISQNMTLMSYADNSLLGSQLHELGGAYEEIAQTLRSGDRILGQRVKEINGISSIVFFTDIFNGWYLGITTPYHSFYRDLYIVGLILIALGIILSLSLCYILLRLSAARIRADEESKFKTSFLASMSHDIRTPMNAITGMAELALRNELPPDVRGYVQDIKQAGNNLIAIINDILDISKIEAGKLEIIPANYMLASIINDTVNIINMKLKDKPIKLYTNIDKTIPNNLIGDETRLRQILMNLLSNAAKYTLKGQINFSIATEKYDSDGHIWLRITVADTGFGIEPEDVKNLFRDFVQVDTKKNRGIEGTGLGLAITKRLCVAMGGDISVESEYGAGSTFTVIIPQGIASPEPLAAMEFNAKSSADSQTLSATMKDRIFPDARILVTDDYPVNLKVVEGLLSPYKIKVDTCLSGEESIELIKQNKYDLVFMDHMMPGMDGIETVKQIREFNKEIPIIALTANAIVGMKEKFIENGFNDFLAKPIDIGKLDEILEKWIGGSNNAEDKLHIQTETMEFTNDSKRNNKNENDSSLKEENKKTSRFKELRNRWRYYGLGKDEYNNSMGLTFTSNLLRLTWANTVFAILAGIFAIFPILTEKDILKSEFYLASAVIAVILCVICRLTNNKYKKTKEISNNIIYLLIFLYFINVMAFGMYLSVWANPGKIAGSFLGMIICVLFLLNISPVLNLGMILGTVIAYIICVIKFKVPSVWNYDIQNAIFAGSLSLIFGWQIIKSRLAMVTSADKLEKERNKYFDQSRFKTAFLASVSHEIRTPINAITGMNELVLRSDISDEVRNYAQEIKHAGANLTSIINDILDFSENSSDKPKNISANNHIASLFNDAQYKLSIKGVDVKQGIASTGGMDNYQLVLGILCDDIKDRLPFLQSMQKEIDTNSLPQFTSQVHSLKGALATIGANEASLKALELEDAGKKEDTAFIKENISFFTEQLTELINNISIALEKDNNK